MSKKPYINIKVENVAFDSVSAVANLCNISKGGLYNALSTNAKSVKGYTIERLGKNSFNLTKKTGMKPTRGAKAAVKVKCLETGKIYPSIGKIAKELGVNMWTMSVKMEETGKFIDKKGRSYVRLSPMVKRTNHTYGFKESSITRNIHRNSNNVEAIKTPSTIISTPSTKDLIIQSLVKSANLLTDTKNYSQAAQVLTILSDFDK